MSVEEEVHDFLRELLGEESFEDTTYDWYDSSVEIFGVKADLVLTEEQQQALWKAGFDRCWTHLGPNTRQPGERYYCKSGAKDER